MLICEHVFAYHGLCPPYLVPGDLSLVLTTPGALCDSCVVGCGSNFCTMALFALSYPGVQPLSYAKLPVETLCFAWSTCGRPLGMSVGMEVDSCGLCCSTLTVSSQSRDCQAVLLYHESMLELLPTLVSVFPLSLSLLFLLLSSSSSSFPLFLFMQSLPEVPWNRWRPLSLLEGHWHAFYLPLQPLDKEVHTVQVSEHDVWPCKLNYWIISQNFKYNWLQNPSIYPSIRLSISLFGSSMSEWQDLHSCMHIQYTGNCSWVSWHTWICSNLLSLSLHG